MCRAVNPSLESLAYRENVGDMLVKKIVILTDILIENVQASDKNIKEPLFYWNNMMKLLVTLFINKIFANMHIFEDAHLKLGT